jgi:hypothetical protein
VAAPGGATPPAGDQPPKEDPSWIKQRLDRERLTTLKALGFDSPEAAQAAIARAKELEAEAERTRLASLTELDREKDRAKKLEADLATERANRERIERAGQLNAACAQLGVKNTGYAAFLLEQQRSTNPTITAEDAIKAALADETQRAALGASPVPTRAVPAGDTTPPGTPPLPATVPTSDQLDATKMTDQEWQNYKAKLQRSG